MADNANCYVFGYCVTDQAWPERLGKIACYGLCQSPRTRVNAVVPANHQDADASRRPTS
jgi:hypothetical protein